MDGDYDWVCEEFLPVFNHHFRKEITIQYGAKGLTCDDIVDVYIPRWITDPQSRGCWRNDPVGSAGKVDFDFGRMGNMILSGEGTCSRHSGWVTGGWYSGERSVRIVLKETYKGFEGLSTSTICDDDKDSLEFDETRCDWGP